MNTISYVIAILLLAVFDNPFQILYTWLFSQGFYFHEFRESILTKIPLQYMAIFSNENITKITKLNPREFLNLVQNRENICI